MWAGIQNNKFQKRVDRLKKIDTHLHFWDLGNKFNNWVLYQTDSSELKKNFLPDALFIDDTLYGVVHIEAHDSAISTINEIKWLSGIMQKYPYVKYAHIAFADITLPYDEFSQIINEIKQHAQVKGIRHILSHSPRYKYNPCDEDISNHKNILGNLQCLMQNKLIFDCQMYPYQLQNILPHIIYSGVTCIIDHCALPAWDNMHDYDLWQKLVIELGQVRHIYLKLSGLDMFKPEEEFAGIVDFCLEHIPYERLMYGSNYPVSFTNNYNYWFDFLNTAIKNAAIKEKIFLNNAANVFFN